MSANGEVLNMSSSATSTAAKILPLPTAHVDQLPISNKSREPLPTNVKSFKRSRTFMTTTGINPLVAAASALFALLTRLRLSEDYPNLTQLKADLIHEVKAFECAAMQRGYDANDILVARYLVCVSFDEAILQTTWGRESQWHESSLLYHFQGELWGGDRIFVMLDHLLAEPKKRMELLQFMYICLSLGCEGKFQHAIHGQAELQALMDKLYRVIRQHKQMELRQLSKTYHLPVLTKQKPALSKTITLVSTLTFGAMLLLQIGLSIGLQAGLAPIEDNLTSITAQSL